MRKRKNDEGKNEKAKGGKKRRGELQKEKEKRERRGGEILDTYRSIKLDPIDIKFRYLVLLNTRNHFMISDKNFNG